jgi:membrane dipeptidase
VSDRRIVVNGLATLPYPPGIEAGGWTASTLVDVMREGGVTAANITLAVDDGFERAALTVARMVRTYSEGVNGARIVRSFDDLVAVRDADEAGLIMGFQNSVALEGSLEKLEFFHTLGVRVIQLTYQRRNLAADGCGETSDAGLSVFGRRLVERMNDLGVLVDLSHTGRRSSLEVIDVSGRPVVFSHANVAALAPHPRNKTDEEIRALAERDGVIGITAIARFLSPETGRATVEHLVDHVEYVAELVGVDHVGIGLDITEGLTRDVYEREKRPLLNAYPELEGPLSFDDYYAAPITGMAHVGTIAQLLGERGYDEADVAKVLGGNFARVLAEVWPSDAGEPIQRAVQPPSTTTVEPVR